MYIVLSKHDQMTLTISNLVIKNKNEFVAFAINICLKILLPPFHSNSLIESFCYFDTFHSTRVISF